MPSNALYRTPEGVMNALSGPQGPLGMNPNVNRLSLLPRYNQREGLVAPQWLYDLARAAEAPGNALMGHQTTPEEALNFAGNVAGAGLGSSAMMRNPAPGPGVTLPMGVRVKLNSASHKSDQGLYVRGWSPTYGEPIATTAAGKSREFPSKAAAIEWLKKQPGQVESFDPKNFEFEPVIKGDALEQARKNAVEMLGLPENNTAADRAKAMGYTVEGYRGSRTAEVDHKKPVWWSEDREYANTYASRLPAPAKYPDMYADQTPNVMPLLVRIGKEGAFGKTSVGGVPFSNGIDGGFDSYIRRYSTDPAHAGLLGDSAGKVWEGLTNPEHIRSKFAAFDPAFDGIPGLNL